MIRVVIIEDEKLIATELAKKLTSLSSPVEVMAILGSVKESIDYFSDGCHADLLFSDIQLSDGLSFDIFERIQCETPVVFVTGFNSFMVSAFEHNGIDYLLKPIDENDLVKVLNKYTNYEKHFKQQNLKKFFERRKARLVVKKGFTNVLLRLEDVVLFYTENKIVYTFDKDGRKYLCEQNLSDLENILDNHNFFRANRQYIVNISYIRGFKPFERVKLSVDLACGELNHLIVISQETAPYFKKWISEN
jgi:two-component system LytT family response regulator